jgi:hypothetical protein
MDDNNPADEEFEITPFEHGGDVGVSALNSQHTTETPEKNSSQSVCDIHLAVNGPDQTHLDIVTEEVIQTSAPYELVCSCAIPTRQETAAAFSTNAHTVATQVICWLDSRQLCHHVEVAPGFLPDFGNARRCTTHAGCSGHALVVLVTTFNSDILSKFARSFKKYVQNNCTENEMMLQASSRCPNVTLIINYDI